MTASTKTRYPVLMAIIMIGMMAMPLTGNRSCLNASERNNTSLALTLPPDWYVVAGVEMSLYYGNIVCTQSLDKYRFKVKCKIGKAEANRYVINAREKDVGRYSLKVTVNPVNGGKTLARARMTLHVISAKAGTNKKIRLLIVGDSLTAASKYPGRIAGLLKRNNNPQWKMLGRVKKADGVRHEGFGGWTWKAFISKYVAGKPGPGKKASSPFVYNIDGRVKLDVAKYIADNCDGTPPDVVTFLLGINDCFGASAKADDLKAVDARIDAMFKNAEILLAEFRRAAPRAILGICLTTPPNSRESAFVANYKGKYHQWGWKRVQHRLVQRMLKHFGGRTSEKIYIIPTQLNIDPVKGFPENNAVHPNACGYDQIGSSVYAWLKSRMASRK